MACQVDDQLETNGYFIPKCLSTGRFTHFAIDNLDFDDSGNDGVTTHGTTHIIYQYPAIEEQCQSNAHTSVHLLK